MDMVQNPNNDLSSFPNRDSTLMLTQITEKNNRDCLWPIPWNQISDVHRGPTVMPYLPTSVNGRAFFPFREGFISAKLPIREVSRRFYFLTSQ